MQEETKVYSQRELQKQRSCTAEDSHVGHPLSQFLHEILISLVPVDFRIPHSRETSLVRCANGTRAPKRIRNKPDPANRGINFDRNYLRADELTARIL